MDGSADLRGSESNDQPYDDSESGRTAEDSGGEDDVYSDLEYSRVMPTPSTGNRRGSRSTPGTPKSTATQKYEARNISNETPVAVRKPTTQTQFAVGRKGDLALGETQTQKVPPLTATQLQNLGLGFADANESPLMPESPSSALLETQEQHDDVSEVPDPIESDDERVSSGSEELGTPRVAQFGSGSYGSGGVVDETPMRYQSVNTSQYVYVLCLWQRKWYPARANRIDYDDSKLSPHGELSSVTFGDGTTARTELLQTPKFDLQVGDRVQVEENKYKGRKFEVVHLIADDDVSNPVRTTSGHSKVRLRPLKLRPMTPTRGAPSMVVVEVGSLSLTKSDYDLWTNTRVQNNEPHNLNGSPIGLQRGKRQRKASISEIAPKTRRRTLAGSREHSLQQFVDSDGAEKQSGATQLFTNCIFSISMSDQADEENEDIKRLIQMHGGTVLENGLSDMVKLTEATESGDMPSHDLRFGDAQFAAVLAEKPRRTIKYLEMLAVGWPCLMSGFVKECIEQGRFVDWVPWTLPAGVSSIQRKLAAPVNANITQFHHGWLRGEKLTSQFLKRRVILKCTIPVCVIVGTQRKDRSEEVSDGQRLFLASLCASQYKLWLYRDRNEVPEGSLLLQLGEKKGQKVLATEPSTLYQMKNLATADEIIMKDASWLLECIINGELI